MTQLMSHEKANHSPDRWKSLSETEICILFFSMHGKKTVELSKIKYLSTIYKDFSDPKQVPFSKKKNPQIEHNHVRLNRKFKWLYVKGQVTRR